MTKVCVYAITKNESKFVERWMKSMSEADYVVVLDTGSTDDTVEKLRSLGATVEQKQITPWRFDVARNESMKLIPEDADVCVCTDLDEVFESGWADCLRENWTSDTEKGKYLYTWNHDENDNPLIQIWYEKIHANTDDWYWVMPVHEVLTHKTKYSSQINMKYLPADRFHLHHYPDPTKSRSQYLGLMKMGIEENPDDFMQQWYYGRELYYHKRFNEAIKQLEYVKTMPCEGFHYQRSAAIAFLAHSYKAIQNYKSAEENYLISANAVSADVREPMLFLTQFYYEQQRWYACIDAGLRALNIDYVKGAWYEDRRNYREKPHDYLSIAYWNIGDMKKGAYHMQRALEYAPDDKRLQNNAKFFDIDK